MLFDQGLCAKALAEAQQMDKGGFAPLIYEFIGNCQFELANYEAALSAYQKALSLDANLDFSYIGLGKLMLHDARPDEAIAQLQQALSLDSKNTVAKYYLALAFEQKGDREAAIRELIEATKLTPEVEGLYEKLAEIYTKVGNTSEADKVLESLRILREKGN
jgi:tetratricopeptide (TPR) repeat protein